MNQPSNRSLDSPIDLPRQLARWRQLVTPEWLAALFAGLPVVAAPVFRPILIEVDCDHGVRFSIGHIPGAGYLDTGRLESGSCWKKVGDAEWLGIMLAYGIRHDSTVLLYGRDALPVARAAQLMLYAGVADVRLLDGGFAAWQSFGRPLESGVPRRATAEREFGGRFPGRPDYIADIAQVRALLQRDDGAVVSIRTWDEFTGRTSGYAYIPMRGDIPGAKWGHAGRPGDTNSMSDYLRADGTMKSPDQIEAFWRDAAVTRGNQAIFYCGTAWRASLAFFYAWLMGWERIAVYDGGWCEWSADRSGLVARRDHHAVKAPS